MNRVLKIIFFLVLVVCFSCEEKGWFINCNDCVSSEPETAELNMKLKDIGEAVKINVYDGLLEDSILYYSGTVNNYEFNLTVALNKTYTVTATYNIDGKKYIAVDSCTPRVKYDEDKCDDPCYYVYDRELDLRLRSTAKD